MKYVSLIVSEDAAHSCVHSLGRLGVLQLTDLNPEQTPFQRRFVGYIKRCDELERKLRYMGKEIESFGLPVSGSSEVGSFGDGKTGAALLDALEVELEKHEEQLLELNNYSKELTTKYNEKIEYQECLEKGRKFFENESMPFGSGLDTPAASNPLLREGSEPLLQDDFGGRGGGAAGGGGFQRTVELDMKFASTVGVVRAEERVRFERMLFRSTRGNCLVRFADVERPLADATTGAPERKLVFIVFYKSDVIGAAIERICQAFGARQYPVPDHTQSGDARKLDALARETAAELSDAREVLLKNRELRAALCGRLAGKYSAWRTSVLCEKAVYHALNLFRADVSGMLRGEGWIVAAAEGEARSLVTRAHAAMDLAGASMLAPVPADQKLPTPPTSFETNDFTNAYQEFVDTYGIPRYKEINPALFTAVTFPFLFGMMYGDIGHGSCVTLGGLYLILTYNKSVMKGDEMVAGIYSARYMLTMMGCCAVYAGLCYNDIFSLALNLFGSRYRYPGAEDGYRGEAEKGGRANATSYYGDASNVYPFGVDPAWHISSNDLLFFNSMKMKTAVIVGVTQMTGGILLKGVNALYFGDRVVFLLEFLPMIIFDFALFGYMVILIFTKWAIDWDHRQLMGTCKDGLTYDGRACAAGDLLVDTCALDFGGTSGGCAPPNLINQLINIALKPGVVDEPMYAGQAGTQTALLLIAFAAVPVLLLGKPLYVYYTAQQHAHPTGNRGGGPHAQHQPLGNGHDEDGHHGDHNHDDDGDVEAIEGDDHGDGESHSFSEVLIHQSIETIEFVLGMVSNTASYLRLWALSLAHTELAQVFWEKTMLGAVNMNNGFAIFVAYSIFAVVTAAVLLAMDLLECFLHALRLHWVEFQNKFYKADGHKFQPFSFAAILDAM